MTRTALITGANRGIGLATARQLAEFGYDVLLGSRNLEAGEEAARSLRRLGLAVTATQVDLGTSESIAAVLRGGKQSGRRVDVVINNAGVLYENPSSN